MVPVSFTERQPSASPNASWAARWLWLWCIAFASLRLLLAYMFALPGKKLLFMGAELAQEREWNHDGSLDWHLLDEPEGQPAHRGVLRFLSELNAIYRREPALSAKDYDEDGFEWIEPDDRDNSVLTFLRRGREPHDVLLITCNFTPVPRQGYRIGVPDLGGTADAWDEVLNSDAAIYGGTGHFVFGRLPAEAVPHHHRQRSIVLTLPPLAAVFLRPARSA